MTLINLTTYYGSCVHHGTYESFTPGCPRCVAAPWPWPAAREPFPPPVCTGSGHGPGAQVIGSGFTGRCGICGQEVALIWTGSASVIATHPYRPAPAEGAKP